MRQDEFDSFKGELKQLCASLGKPYTDALGQAYWRVLRDIPLAEVEANVERILLTASRETKFPKPMELRTTPTRVSGQLPEVALKLNEESWRAKFAHNPELARIEQTYLQYQRVISSSNSDSAEYAMAVQESLHIIRRHGDPRFFDYA